VPGFLPSHPDHTGLGNGTQSKHLQRLGNDVVFLGSDLLAKLPQPGALGV
jgi:hypothetical protein